MPQCILKGPFPQLQLAGISSQSTARHGCNKHEEDMVAYLRLSGWGVLDVFDPPTSCLNSPLGGVPLGGVLAVAAMLLLAPMTPLLGAASPCSASPSAAAAVATPADGAPLGERASGLLWYGTAGGSGDGCRRCCCCCCGDGISFPGTSPPALPPPAAAAACNLLLKLLPLKPPPPEASPAGSLGECAIPAAPAAPAPATASNTPPRLLLLLGVACAAGSSRMLVKLPLPDTLGEGLGLRNRDPGPGEAGVGRRAGFCRTTSSTNSAIHSAIFADTISNRPCMQFVSRQVNWWVQRDACMSAEAWLSSRL